MIGVLPALTRDYIESQIDQIDIFAYYLGINSSEIHSCIGTNYTICSPLREDKNPPIFLLFYIRSSLIFSMIIL